MRGEKRRAKFSKILLNFAVRFFLTCISSVLKKLNLREHKLNLSLWSDLTHINLSCRFF